MLEAAETHRVAAYYPDLYVSKPSREVRSLHSNGTSSLNGSPPPQRYSHLRTKVSRSNQQSPGRDTINQDAGGLLHFTLNSNYAGGHQK